MAEMDSKDRGAAVRAAAECALEFAQDAAVSVGDRVYDRTDTDLRLGILMSVDDETARIAYNAAENAVTEPVALRNVVNASEVDRFLRGE